MPISSTTSPKPFALCAPSVAKTLKHDNAGALYNKKLGAMPCLCYRVGAAGDIVVNPSDLSTARALLDVEEDYQSDFERS